jgi:hypothetical protein
MNLEIRMQTKTYPTSHLLSALLISFLLYFGMVIVLFPTADNNMHNKFFLQAYTGVEESKLSFLSNNVYTNLITTLLDNFTKKLEYTFELDGNQIFPNDSIKQDTVRRYKLSEYNINNLKYEIIGFTITASNVKIHVDPKKIDNIKTRVDIPVMTAKNVKVSNGVINLAYNEVDLGSVYGIYDSTTDKMIVHVPINVASKYIHLW